MCLINQNAFILNPYISFLSNIYDTLMGHYKLNSVIIILIMEVLMIDTLITWDMYSFNKNKTIISK